MAIQEITIDMSLLADDIAVLEENVAALREQMALVFQDINDLDAMWDGPANAEFNAQFNADYASMEAMCKTFDTIIESYAFANKEYNTCENSVHDIVAAIKI